MQTNNCRELMVLNWATKQDLKNKKGIIYRIVNITNQKSYIGKASKSFSERYVSGWFKNKHNAHFKASKKKYGEGSFKIEILAFDVHPNVIPLLERFFIKQFQSMNKKYGYNKTTGGERGYKFDLEVRARIAEKQRIPSKQFFDECKTQHNGKYNYSESVYINDREKIQIICPTHGPFWQGAGYHKKGCGCKKCYGNDKKTTEEFIQQAQKIHGDKFDYSEVKYEGWNSNVVISCKKHNIIFKPIALDHLQSKHCCPLCTKEAMSIINYKNFPPKNQNPVLQIDVLSGEVLRTFKSSRDAATFLFENFDLNLSITNLTKGLSQSLKRGNKSYKGFSWKYLTE